MQDGDIHKNEEMIFNPYNENNREIKETDINNILKNYGVPDTVHNLNLYKPQLFINHIVKTTSENVANEIIIAEPKLYVFKKQNLMNVLIFG